MKRLPILIGIAILIVGVVFIARANRPQGSSISQLKENSNLQNPTVALSQDCSGQPIPGLTEGPYYTPGSPQRQDIREPNSQGDELILEGYVFDEDCKPIPGAWLDFWQADGNGEYDNAGFELRGHQFTDNEGKYRLVTVVPKRYTGRTEHIHFKVRAPQSEKVITSQLFFPDSKSNNSDSIYNERLLIKLGQNARPSTYNIVINAQGQ